ncbi:MAG: TlpA disulfide reductase family protein [Chitinophagaceae bacterium]
MTRYILCSTIFACLYCVAYTQDNRTFYITGKVENDKIKSVTLQYRDIDSKVIKKTDSVSNGRFAFSGTINGPTEAWLRNDGNKSDMLFIEPGNMKIDIKDERFKSLSVSGSKTYNEYDSLEKAKEGIYQDMKPFEAKLGKLNDSLGVAFKMKDTPRIKEIMDGRKLLFSQMKPYFNKIAVLNLKFVAKHPDSYLSTYLLFTNYGWDYIGIDTVKSYFGKLSPIVQNGYYGQKIKVDIGVVKPLPIGSLFPNMNGLDMNGSITSINSLLQQQYTLVIFWASWCPPCREHVPDYKKIYQSYQKQGLKIIAITQDWDKMRWLDAIRKDSTQNWQHFFPDNIDKLVDICGLSSIPAQVLLDGNKVIAKFGGADDKYADLNALDNKLKAVFSSGEQ